MSVWRRHARVHTHTHNLSRKTTATAVVSASWEQLVGFDFQHTLTFKKLHFYTSSCQSAACDALQKLTDALMHKRYHWHVKHPETKKINIITAIIYVALARKRTIVTHVAFFSLASTATDCFYYSVMFRLITFS